MTGDRPVLVAAVAANGVIGDGGDIPWRVPGEMAHFKAVTMGGVLVMGRRTYESIGRPLPGRRTVVITADPCWSADGVQVARSLSEGLALARSHIENGSATGIFISGGARVYAEAMPLAGELVITEIPLSPDGDTCFPAIDPAEWTVAQRASHPGFDVVRYRRADGGTAPGAAGDLGSS